MLLRPETLPRDPNQLIEIVLACDEKIESLEATISTLRTMIFGARSERSSALIVEQIPLDLDDLISGVATPVNDDQEDDTSDKKSALKAKKRKRNIGSLPKHLPRVDVLLEPDSLDCPCCANKLHVIGSDVNEVLDKIPAIYRVLRYIRPKYACRSCSDTVVQAKARPRLIESGMASGQNHK